MPKLAPQVFDPAWLTVWSELVRARGALRTVPLQPLLEQSNHHFKVLVLLLTDAVLPLSEGRFLRRVVLFRRCLLILILLFFLSLLVPFVFLFLVLLVLTCILVRLQIFYQRICSHILHLLLLLTHRLLFRGCTLSLFMATAFLIIHRRLGLLGRALRLATPSCLVVVVAPAILRTLASQTLLIRTLLQVVPVEVINTAVVLFEVLVSNGQFWLLPLTQDVFNVLQTDQYTIIIGCDLLSLYRLLYLHNYLGEVRVHKHKLGVVLVVNVLEHSVLRHIKLQELQQLKEQVLQSLSVFLE